MQLMFGEKCLCESTEHKQGGEHVADGDEHAWHFPELLNNLSSLFRGVSPQCRETEGQSTSFLLQKAEKAAFWIGADSDLNADTQTIFAASVCQPWACSSNQSQAENETFFFLFVLKLCCENETWQLLRLPPGRSEASPSGAGQNASKGCDPAVSY